MSTATFMACLTPPGQSAIATLAVHGPDAWQAVGPIFRTRSAQPLATMPKPAAIVLGRLGADVADEVVLAVKRGGEMPWLELHTHGGREVNRFLIDTLTARGLTVCSWEEFQRRTAENRLQALAAIALARAPTVRTAAILLEQYHGAFAAAIRSVRDWLDGRELDKARAGIAVLAGQVPLGKHLTSPWRVAVAGAPNVGKSSLINALTGFERSVVSPQPGTTRDLVTTLVALDGWPIELIDMAGIREGAGALEEQGIQLAREQAEEADACLWILDSSSAPIWPPRELAAKARLVLNKIDLPSGFDAAGVEAIPVSARTGEGLAMLAKEISTRLVPCPPKPGAALPFCDEICNIVIAAGQALADNRIEEVLHLLGGLTCSCARSEPIQE